MIKEAAGVGGGIKRKYKKEGAKAIKPALPCPPAPTQKQKSQTARYMMKGSRKLARHTLLENRKYRSQKLKV